MSPHGTITAIYRATVTIPDDVYEIFKDKPEFKSIEYECSRGAVDSGSNTFDKYDTWAEYHTRLAAYHFIYRWNDQILRMQSVVRRMSDIRCENPTCAAEYKQEVVNNITICPSCNHAQEAV